MSRTKLGSCCALLAIVGVLLADSLSAQEKSAEDTAAAHGDMVHAALDRINAILDQPLKAPLEAIEEPLNEILNRIQSDYDFSIVFDNAALDEVAISPETEVTVNLRSISLRSALDLMLKQPGLGDLTYVIDHGLLLITTKERANEMIATRVYRVDDFEHFSPNKNLPGSATSPFSSLLDTIVNCVQNDSWARNGTGEGQIHLLKPGIFVITQTNQVHREVEELLAALRAVKAQIQKEALDNR